MNIVSSDKHSKNILFITATRLGDAILSCGLLEYMHQRWPEGKVTVACGALPSSIFLDFPNVCKVIPMVKKSYHRHWIELWGQVLAKRWDLVIDIRNSAVSRLVLAGEKYIYGKHIDAKAHKVEQMAQLLGLQGEDIPSPKLYPNTQSVKKAQEVFSAHDKVLAVGPAANWIGKTWPAERFCELLQKITAADGIFPEASVAIFAAPGEEDQAYAVFDSLDPKKRIDRIAKGSPADVVADIACCDFYIGNDSGLMHMAAALGIPTFGLFGPSYPHLYGPWGDHCAYAQTPESFDELIDFEGYDPKTLDRSLMTSLSVNDVMQALEGFVRAAIPSQKYA